MASPDEYQEYIGLVDLDDALRVVDETFEHTRSYV